MLHVYFLLSCIITRRGPARISFILTAAVGVFWENWSSACSALIFALSVCLLYSSFSFAWVIAGFISFLFVFLFLRFCVYAFLFLIMAFLVVFYFLCSRRQGSGLVRPGQDFVRLSDCQTLVGLLSCSSREGGHAPVSIGCFSLSLADASRFTRQDEKTKKRKTNKRQDDTTNTPKKNSSRNLFMPDDVYGSRFLRLDVSTEPQTLHEKANIIYIPFISNDDAKPKTQTRKAQDPRPEQSCAPMSMHVKRGRLAFASLVFLSWSWLLLFAALSFCMPCLCLLLNSARDVSATASLIS